MGKKQDDLMRQALSEFGRKGGRASAQKLSKEQRIVRARKAGKASAKARKEGQQ